MISYNGGWDEEYGWDGVYKEERYLDVGRSTERMQSNMSYMGSKDEAQGWWNRWALQSLDSHEGSYTAGGSRL